MGRKKLFKQPFIFKYIDLTLATIFILFGSTFILFDLEVLSIQKLQSFWPVANGFIQKFIAAIGVFLHSQ